MNAAAEAQPFWAALPLRDRARYLHRAAQVVLDVSSELVAFLAREHGRTPGEAWTLDLAPGIDALHWAAAMGERALGARRVRPRTPLARGRRTHLVRVSVGLVGVRPGPRAPWAWPLEHIGVALMAGNGVLLPDDGAGDRLVRVFERAGVPDGIVSLGSPEELAAAAVLLDDAAAGLEDPGPMLVLADAEIGRAGAAAAWGAFAAQGRVPAGVARVLVSREVAERLGRDVADRAPRGGALDVLPVSGEEEALSLAAAGPRGGGASVWSADAGRAARMARSLDFPVVWVNDHATPVPPRSPAAFDRVTRVSLHGGSGYAPWWGSIDPVLAGATATLLYGRERDRAVALRAGARPLLRLAARRLRG